MKDWLTAAEIAAESLPGVPTTERGVRKAADREGWAWRPREASGGGREYPLTALPTAARAAYAAKHIRVLGLPTSVGLPVAADAQPAPQPVARAAEHRDARLVLLAAADMAAEEAKLSQKRADHVFAQGYTLGQIEVDAWIREAVPTLSTRTLARWRKYRKAGETSRLAVDKGAARRGQGLLETANAGAVKTFCLALLVKNPFFSADQIRRMVGGEFGGELSTASGELVPVPSLRTFQDALSAWKGENKVALTQMTDPDGFRSKYKVSGRNSLAHITKLNQLWMLDASPLDMLCVDGRYSVYVAVDVFSRRMMVYLSRTPRAEAVGLLMRRALLAWGVPHEVKTDNGSDFVAKATRGLFAAIRLDHVTCRPFEPNEKPHVESAIKTFQHAFVPLLDGYIGHSVADRKKIEGRRAFSARLGTDDRQLLEVKLTAADVQAKADEWIRLVYEHRPHEGLARRTPFAVASASRDAIRMVDAAALDVLLAPLADKGGLRVVSKYGIKIAHAYYLVPAHVQPGDQVMVRMDPMDLGRALVFDPSGAEYLGEAICPVLEGTDPKAAVAAKKRAQAEHLAEQTRKIRKEARRIGKGTAVVDLVLRDAARQAGTLVELPKRTERYTTPELDAAAEAAAPRAPAPVPQMSPEARAMRAQLTAAGPDVVPLRTTETPRQRYNRACDMERRLARGETLTPEETVFLVGYASTPEYRAFRETFGSPAMTNPATAG